MKKTMLAITTVMAETFMATMPVVIVLIAALGIEAVRFVIAIELCAIMYFALAFSRADSFSAFNNDIKVIMKCGIKRSMRTSYMAIPAGIAMYMMNGNFAVAIATAICVHVSCCLWISFHRVYTSTYGV